MHRLPVLILYTATQILLPYFPPLPSFRGEQWMQQSSMSVFLDKVILFVDPFTSHISHLTNTACCNPLPSLGGMGGVIAWYSYQCSIQPSCNKFSTFVGDAPRSPQMVSLTHVWWIFWNAFEDAYSSASNSNPRTSSTSESGLACVG